MTQAAEDANTIHSTSQPETPTIQTLDADQISAVIWYTVTQLPNCSWHKFAEQIMKAERNAEFLRLVCLLYGITYENRPNMTWQERDQAILALKALEN